MPISEQEKATLNRILQLIPQRGGLFYETGVQTTVLARTPSGWRNLLTKFDFVCKGKPRPHEVSYEYEHVAIIRRLLSHAQVASVLEKLSKEDLLETGGPYGTVRLQSRLREGENTRSYPREWTEWPSDIFTLEARTDEYGGWPRNEPLIATDLPYFPTLEHVLWQFFGFRQISWMDYFRGQVVFVLPDFRARISKLTIALGYLRADFECVFLRPDELVAKVHAENASRLLAQETVHLSEPGLQVDLDDRPTFASVALVSKPTGETLHLKSFQEGRGWQDPAVILETSQQEIEQMLLIGESETLEFREMLQKESHLRLAKTAVAFANTKGGTIVIGVDDDHQVVGCETKGLGDTVTNVLRSYCDPPLSIETEVVQYQDKRLFLVKVIQSKDRVHILKDHGPFIRANGTNRTPTSDELARLCRRRTGGVYSTLNP
jgi:hypothetical protein